MRLRSFVAPSALLASTLSCSTGDGGKPSVENVGVTAAATAELSTETVASPERGSRGEKLSFTPVANANTKTAGVSSPNVLPPELIETAVAQGSTPVENPASVTLSDGTTVRIPYFGYTGDGPLLPPPGAVPSEGDIIEATKTEPDKNTYLVVPHQKGADAGYDYGSHFVYQGHESGQTGVITRVNLDADALHKVTILASTMADGTPLPVIDGSTWDPFAKKLVFTTEEGASPGLSAMQASLDFPSVVESLTGSLGNAAYEGVQNDPDGNLWLVEDAGGKTSTTYPHSKQPNSFVFRFVPNHAHDLEHGRLQALQVLSLRSGSPIAFHADASAADAASDDVGDLHTYGKVFKTRWVTVHDTGVDGTDAFDANALAKSKLATPFKRPENGQFRPGSRFGEFYFAETGDTDARTEVGAPFGGFGSILKLSQVRPSSNEGTLTLFFLGDVAHTGLDNVSFWSKNEVVFVEDAGDTLHTQRNALDSAWLFDVRRDYSKGTAPVRLFAEGRDPSATLDSAFGAYSGFQNEGDNEITGFHVSNGDPSPDGILGAQDPTALSHGWRAFFTQQHGDNYLWELAKKPSKSDD